VMMIYRKRPYEGTWFAWRPVWTPEGLIWLEPVRFRRKTVALGGYIYDRLPSYIVHDGATTEYTTLPQDKGVTLISKCKELRRDGPTPCHYPHCTCMNEGGSTCGAQ